MPSLSLIKQQAHTYQARKKWYRSLSLRAAVCVIVAEQPNLGLSLLMIQRAIHPGDTWSGHMAFPGGKHETDDAHITQTALRECQEELGIAPQALQRFGRLSDILAKPYRLQQKPMVVSPLLFSTDQTLDFTPNDEVADVLWIPLSHFLDSNNRQRMVWKNAGFHLDIPCYDYQDKRIWGISLIVIDEMINQLVKPVSDADLGGSPPPAPN